MKNNHQIEIIIQAHNKQRERYLSELSKINTFIRNKNNLIIKMEGYVKDYYHEKKLMLTKSVPGLHGNLARFTNQIEEVILKTRVEIDHLEFSQQNIISKIQKIDQKIDLMKTFEARNKFQARLKEDNIEQMSIDDMAANKYSRSKL